jgi:uncharacterized membrane protein YcaP (DUF421 family)
LEGVLRALVLYGGLLVLFRLAGKRSLGQISTFDFVLLLIISEAAQNGMVGESYSLTHAFVLIMTLIAIDIGLSLMKRHFPRLDKLIEGVPLVIVENGRPLHERMLKSRVAEDDVLTAARKSHGLERMAQIKYAVLERDGAISVIPFRGSEAGGQRAA